MGALAWMLDNPRAGITEAEAMDGAPVGLAAWHAVLIERASGQLALLGVVLATLLVSPELQTASVRLFAPSAGDSNPSVLLALALLLALVGMTLWRGRGHVARFRRAVQAALLAREVFLRTVHSLHRYPSTDHAALRDAIGETHGLDPARVICGVGSDEIIHFLCQAYAGPKDEVVYTEHGFLMYRISAMAAWMSFCGSVSFGFSPRLRAGRTAGAMMRFSTSATPQIVQVTWPAFDRLSKASADLNQPSKSWPLVHFRS